jgi:glycyl-tRNA synthetase beta subunit
MRIAAACTSILLRQEDEEREITGPPKSVAYDLVGAPTRAATLFKLFWKRRSSKTVPSLVNC